MTGKGRWCVINGIEPKKLALLRIYQILCEYSDSSHLLKQEDIARLLETEYGIIMERKAIGRNISLLREAGFDIVSLKNGSYLVCREFEDAELHLLIDGVMSSRYITERHSRDLINRLCGLSNRYFRSGQKSVYSLHDWSKTDNQELFFNIAQIDSAIERRMQISYDYNKYGIDKHMHKTSHHQVSPYQMLMRNQRYYLMAYSEYWGNMVFHRLDHITDMKVTEQAAVPLRSIPGYEGGINYRELSSARPYMYSDRPVPIEFRVTEEMIDQVIDWFGCDISIFRRGTRDERVTVRLVASPKAMLYWSLQYIECVEVIAPLSLREQIRDALRSGLQTYCD